MPMRFLSFVLFLASVASGVADTPRREVPMVTASQSGRCFFAMLPTHWKGPSEMQGPFGIAYEQREDGSKRELWRLNGSYFFKCFLSDDGRYLVAICDWPIGRKPIKEDVAVVFYDRGKQIGQFSTADLVKDASKVDPSASHYQWCFWPKEVAEEFPGPEAPGYNSENSFRLTTVDGISYTFDVTRAAITATRHVVIPPVE
jgi:hypothetical protein